MSVAKRLQKPKSAEYLIRGIMGTEEEKRLIDAYFASHQHLKRGHTIKSWIMSAIASEESGQAQEMKAAMGRAG